MVASRQVENPFHRGTGRQRGRGFVTFAQVLGRKAIPLLPKYIIPAAKLVGADLLEFSVPEIGDVPSERKIFKTAANSVARRTLRKQLLVVAGKGVQAESFQENMQNKPVGRKKTFLQTFLINHVE